VLRRRIGSFRTVKFLESLDGMFLKMLSVEPCKKKASPEEWLEESLPFLKKTDFFD